MRRVMLVLLVLVLPANLWAGEAEPALVIRARSLDAIQGQGKTLFDQLGLGKAAEQLETLFKTKAGVKGFDGVDVQKPFGVIVQFNPDPAGALVLPITTEKAFLALLERLDCKTAKNPDGIYTLKTSLPIEFFLKFDQNHAWITPLNKGFFQAKFDSGKVLASGGPLLEARLRIDAIAKDARQLAISEFEAQMQTAQVSALKTATTPGAKNLTTVIYQGATQLFSQVMQEGQALTGDIDLVNQELLIKFDFRPVPGTDLAKTLTASSTRASVFPAQAPAGSAFYAQVNLALAKSLSDAVVQLFDESFEEAKLTDVEKKKKSQALLQALKPTLQAGIIDGHLRMVGPNPEGKFGVLLGLKTSGGEPLGATIRSLLEDARKDLAEAEQAKIQLDADTVGNVKIHRVVLPAPKGGLRSTYDLLGESILSAAFREDALFFGVGGESGTILKEAISARGTGTASPLALIEIDAARLARFLAPEEAWKKAEAVFRQPGDGLIRVRAEGGNSLRVQVSIRLPVLQFLGQTRTAKQP